jgi:capsular exopolysaccharide synthesis family protein
MQSQNYFNKGFDKEGDTLNIKAELEKYLRHWKWFVLGIIIALGLAFLYLRYTAPSYVAQASILIKDNKKSGISAELEAFKDLGIIGGGSSNNPDNEIEILRSRKIIGNVVDSLEFYVNYFVPGRVIESEVYKDTSPLRLDFVQNDSIYIKNDTLLSIRILNNYTFEFLSEENPVSQHAFGEIISSSVGNFKIIKNPVKSKEERDIVTIKIRPKNKVVDSYRARVSISAVDKNSSVLVLSLQDPVREKAEDFLNELVRQYNIDAINDKNQVSEKTKDFIDSRLEAIGEELGKVQDDAKEYKQLKDFTGLPSEVQLALESLNKSNQDVIQYRTELSWVENIYDILTTESQQYDVLPVSLGFEDLSLSTEISNYNKLVIERNRAKLVAGERNPILLQIESNIRIQKANLIKSLENVIASLKLSLSELNKEKNKILSKVKSIPENERGYIDIARRQEIMAGLYSYLLKKREETDISLAVSVPNAKIIDSSYSSNTPVSPKKKIIYIAAFIIGIITPFVFIYIKDLLDTKVHNKQDIESELSVPFLGDVPKSDSKEKVVIGSDVRSSTAEAFRLIRTNLDFMLASNRKESKSIFVTSTTSGEGKSFISINLAATLALSGKKVLLMGMDLRAPKVTEYLGLPERKGITNYITDEDIILEDLIFQIPQVKGLDIIASGVIPPNPAELLMTKRVENLFTIVKQEYDVVLVDTAPVNLVTDTLLIGKYADMFMYVVRANYLDKRLLAVPQELYNEKKLPNMAIVLNDTDPKRSYGYGYGGYGYGYVVVEKPWYKKIFSKDS